MDITIRRMRSGDADELYRLLSDPVVMRYLEPPYDRVQTEAFLHDAGLSEPPLVYAVQEDERFIGYVIYHEYDATVWRAAGYCFRSTGGAATRRS